MINLRDIAQTYWNYGFEVIPIKNKRGHVKDWIGISEEDLFKSKSWNTANGIGLKCGSHSGVIALDNDFLASMEHLGDFQDELYAKLPPALISRRGNPNKIHTRFFRFNGERSRKFNNIHIEILSSTNYCVLPPSVHPEFKDHLFTWTGKGLLDIDIDDLPCLPDGFIDWLEEKNQEHKKKSERGEVEIIPAKGRCAHGSNNKISAYSLQMLREGLSSEEMIKTILKYDLRLNDNSKFTYFNCPSRPEFRGLTREQAAAKFIGEMFFRRADQIGKNAIPDPEPPHYIETGSVTTEKVSTPEITQNLTVIGNDAIQEMTAPQSKAEIREIWEELGIKVSKVGRPTINEQTCAALLDFDPHYHGGILFDDFKETIVIKNKSKKLRPIKDADYIYILHLLQSRYGFDAVTKTTVVNAVQYVAQMNTVNSCKDWMKGLKWDGTKRVGKFFHNYVGEKETDYTDQVSVNFWVSMVARVLRSGCKVDNMIILEGPQGARKSSMLDVIGGEWFAENTANIGDKDYYINLQGLMLVELAELDAFKKSEINTIKRVISARKDRYRGAYDRHAKDYNRKCIFAGTTNDEEYLNDDTGGRRFWPIRCKKILLEQIRKDRDQLFAEAVLMFEDKVEWWIEPKDAKQIQEQRRIKDPWTESIGPWTTNRLPFEITEVLTQCLNIRLESVTRSHRIRAAKSLRELNFMNKNAKNKAGEQKRLWFKCNI